MPIQKRLSAILALTFAAINIVRLALPPACQAQAKTGGQMMSDYDAENKIEFLDERQSSGETGKQNTLSSGRGSGETDNAKTIRELLGPDLKSISITWVDPTFETHALFLLARQAISDALQKSPRRLYGYTAWANLVKPQFIGKLHYDKGKVGVFQLAYGYICFQDESGKFWWTRFTTPSDLNLTQVEGELCVQSGHGYSIKTKDGREIWLKMVEDKVLVRDLQALTGKVVSAKGELRKVPANVTTSIPANAFYLDNGFTIALKH
jgi:hypothetical protein